jgi:tetratricopeptide (TPR) repeat protein
MLQKNLLLVVLFAAVAIGVSAQAFTVSYLDGSVELKAAKGWKVLAIGEKVPADGTVRLSQDATLELQRGTVRISLIKDGVYEMARLATATDKPASGGSGNLVAQKLQSLTTAKAKATSVGGVRATEQARSPDAMPWAVDIDDVRSDVNDLLDKQNYADALKRLDKAVSEATEDSERNEFAYLKAVVYYREGQQALAYRALARAAAQPADSWYAQFIVLKGQILVDTQNYQDAVALLAPFVKDYTGEAVQVAYLLTAISEKALGNAAAAKQALDAGYALDPATDTAKLIDQQRKAQ